jgi:hypothetical protein
MSGSRQLEIYRTPYRGFRLLLDPSTNKISLPWDHYRRFFNLLRALCSREFKPEGEEWPGSRSTDYEHPGEQGVFAFYRSQVIALYAFEDNLYLRVGRRVFPLTVDTVSVYEKLSKHWRRFRLLDENSNICFETTYYLSSCRLRKILDPPFPYMGWPMLAEDFDFFMYLANIIGHEEKFKSRLEWWRIPRVEISIRKSQLFLNGEHFKLPSEIMQYQKFDRLFLVRLDAYQVGEQNVVAFNDNGEPVWTIQAAPYFEGASGLPGYSRVTREQDQIIVWTWRGEIYEVDKSTGMLMEKLDPRR